MEGRQQAWLVVGILIVVVFLGLYLASEREASITGKTISGFGDVGKIKIGFMGPLTGDAASYGESIKKGVDLALKDSGLDNVEIVYEDTKCDGKEAVSGINKLISVNRVIAVVGEVCSGATLAAAPIAERNKVVMISSSSTSPDITNSGDYIFRTVPSDALQGKFAAELIKKEGYDNLAILYGNEEYGVGFNNVLWDEFEALGGNVVASETFERGSVDLRTQLTKIRSKKPDVIFIISNSPDSAVAALTQIRELGISSSVYGSEGLKSEDILEAGGAAEGLVVTSVSSGTTEFAKRHNEEYGKEPGPFAAQAYDAFMAIAMALKENPSSSEELKEKLYDVEFDGASGRIKFDKNGDVSGNYDVYKVIRGRFMLVV